MLVQVTEFIEQLITNMGVWAPVLACALILFESMVPVLPLCTFITVNFISFGSFWGFILSWIFTCLGCFLSYYLVRKGFRHWYKTRMQTASTFDKSLEYVKELSFTKLTVLLSLPFTPAFAINIAAGLCNMNFKKFFWSIIISKIFMVYFWGFVGVGLVQSFTSPIVLLKIAIMLVAAYVISLIVNKYVEIK